MAEPRQRYVSTELTHFVGRDHPGNIQAQFDTLLRIFRDKCIKPRGWTDDDPNAATSLQFRPDGSLCDESLFRSPNVVCFCDIPVPDLPLHMRKYGRVGLAFSKRYLIRNGASPVFYVARDAAWGERTLGEYFDEMAAQVADQVFLTEGTVQGGALLFLGRAFALVKCFDGTAVETDPANFYMEREWRLLGKLDFHMKDVRQVIMPRRRFKEFRDRVRDYMGELIAAKQPRI